MPILRRAYDAFLRVETARFMAADVAKMWQDDQSQPVTANARQRVPAGQAHNANDYRQQSLSVPRFPWYYWKGPNGEVAD